ncbi:hypothetical protein [Bifidobacterium sp. ESL0764]|uniref:hypothetical protein n=1 Tax=Bifidobacterium sp. ESL0764 TaxID=2983228 RepID=UPI0023F6EA27|nr:hypothetical protein [Bifidobacterium sp. ESL0764]WEV65678.1 hypothetical protein OZX71_08010 [Bifidobacterium sp. ESL0764]
MPQAIATTPAVSAARKRKTVLILSLLAAVLVLGACYAAANALLFSPKAVVREYLNALTIDKGDIPKANRLVDPQVHGPQAVLLHSDRSAGIGTYSIDNTKQTTDGSYQVHISYNANGGAEQYKTTLRVESRGRKYLLFNNWVITTPLVKTIKMMAYSTIDKFTINDTPVTLKNSCTRGKTYSENSNINILEFKAYPGVYQVSYKNENKEYVDAQVNERGGGAPIPASDGPVLGTEDNHADKLTPIFFLTAKPKLKKDLQTAVNKKVDECVAAHDSKGCGYGFDGKNGFTFTKINKYPELYKIYLDSGTFDSFIGIGEGDSSSGHHRQSIVVGPIKESPFSIVNHKIVVNSIAAEKPNS